MESTNQVRAIFYDFFAGVFLRNLLNDREELIKVQLKTLGLVPLDDYVENSFKVLQNKLDSNGFATIVNEFDNVFMIPLNGEVVFPYVSHYKNGCFNGEVLIDIRQLVKELPIRADNTIFKETEDHLGFLFLMMRYCIESNEYETTQKELFNLYIKPYVSSFINDIIENEKSHFYKEIALILKSFMEFEVSYIK